MEKIVGKKKFILVDGSNVALFRPTRKGNGRYNNIKKILTFLKDLQLKIEFKYEIVIDASLRHHIDNLNNLENDISKGKIIQCPSRTCADYFILEYYKRYPEKVIIISNDNFSEFNIQNLNICKFAFIFNDLILYPHLENIFLDKRGAEEIYA